MFQFNKHLWFFAFILLKFTGILSAKVDDDKSKLKDYNIVYDQRQSGSYNFNVKVVGLVVHLPTETPETPAPSLPSYQIPNLLDGVLANSDQLSNFFNWKKNDANPDPIPSIYSEDLKRSSSNIVRAQRRLYN